MRDDGPRIWRVKSERICLTTAHSAPVTTLLSTASSARTTCSTRNGRLSGAGSATRPAAIRCSRYGMPHQLIGRYGEASCDAATLKKATLEKSDARVRRVRECTGRNLGGRLMTYQGRVPRGHAAGKTNTRRPTVGFPIGPIGNG